MLSKTMSLPRKKKSKNKTKKVLNCPKRRKKKNREKSKFPRKTKKEKMMKNRDNSKNLSFKPKSFKSNKE